MSITPSETPARTPATPRRRRGPCTFKQRDATAAVKAVAKAGVEITGVKIAPDGSIRLTELVKKDVPVVKPRRVNGSLRWPEGRTPTRAQIAAAIRDFPVGSIES